MMCATKNGIIASCALGGVLLLVMMVYSPTRPVPVRTTTPAPQVATTVRTTPTVTIRGNSISVTIADTEASRELGLGGRTGLAPDEGMLFVFPVDDTYGFWMKDMLFPIDILWSAADGRIVYMQERVATSTYPAVFTPNIPAHTVLELPAGYAHAHGIQAGDTMTFSGV